MAITIEQYTALFDSLMSLEKDMGAIRSEMGAVYEKFANEHDLNVKSVKRSYKYYKELQKDKAEFVLIDTETSTIIEAIIVSQEPVSE